MKLFWSYFRSHISGMIAFFLCCAIFLLIFSLCDLRIEAVLYGSVLSAVVCLTLFGAGFFRYYRKCMSLRQVQKEILPRMQFIRFLIYDCLTFSCLSCGPGAFFSLVHILVLEVKQSYA